MPHRTARRLLSGLAAAALAAGVALGTTAGASADPVAALLPQDCWILVETGESTCVTRGEDLASAVLQDAGYTMLDGPEEGTAARGTTASYNLGIIFDDIAYGGSSYTFQTSDPAICTLGRSYGAGDLRLIGWNDRLSSFYGYNGCRGVLYQNIDYGGGSYGPTSASSWVGASYNDWASSLRFMD